MNQFLDGFDFYGTDWIGSKYTVNSSCSIVSGGRNGGSCLYVPAGGGYVSRTMPARAAWVVGYAMKWGDGLPNYSGGWSTNCVWTSPFGNISQPSLCSVVLNPDRTMSLFANTTQIGYSSLFKIKTNTWYSFQIACSFAGNPIQTTASLKINGQLVIDSATGSTGLSTDGTNFGAALSNSHAWFPGAFGCYVDDVYIFDALGGVNDSFSGDLSIGYTSAIADVTVDWTNSSGSSAHALISEVPPDGDSSYIYSDTTTQADDFSFAAIDETVGTIVATQIDILARKDGDEGPRSIQGRLAGATTGLEFSLTNDYQAFQTSIDSITSVDGLNASTFGVQLVV